MARPMKTAAEKAAWKKKMDEAKRKKAAEKGASPKKAAKKPAAKKPAAKKPAAKKPGAKMSAPKKAAKKSSRKKPRAKKKSATLASALKKMGTKKASPPKTGTNKRRRNTLKGAMAKLGGKKASPPKSKTKRKSSKRRKPSAGGGKPAAAVLGHAPLRGSCVKCGEPHSLSAHWSHLANHSTSKTKHSYLCARGGFCVFDAEGKLRKPDERAKLFAKAARLEAQMTSDPKRQAKLLQDYLDLTKQSGAFRSVSPLAVDGSWRKVSPSFQQQFKRRVKA